MQLSSDTSHLLYDSIAETVNHPHLAPKEQLPRLRQVLEELLKEVTRDERQGFSDLFSRSLFVFQKYRVPESIVKPVHHFRKLANKAVHELLFVPTPADVTASVRALCALIQHLSGQAVPDTLVQVYQAQPAAPAPQPTPRVLPDKLEFVRGVILHTGETKTVQRDDGSTGTHVRLFCAVDEPAEMETISLLAWDTWAELGQIAWPYACIQGFNLKKVPNSDDLYATTADSLVVLEPDVLVNASDIANCFNGWQDNNPLIYLLNKFTPTDSSISMITGNVVNGLFDALLKNRNTDFEPSFQEIIRQNVLALMAAGQPEAVVATTRTVLESSRQQFDVLRGVVQRLPAQTISIEPTFLSARYGLQGRLDALVEPSDPGEKRLIELKSGKPPRTDNQNGTQAATTWNNHKMQAVCYNLLLESTFGEWTGKASILYSQAAQFPLRDVVVTPYDRRMALGVRNHIVALEHGLQTDAYQAIEQLITSTGAFPKYMEGDLYTFADALRRASELERAYFYHFVAFISREHHRARVGEAGEEDKGFASLWQKDLGSKQQSAIYDLTLDEVQPEGGELHFVYGRNHQSNFRAGDIIVLYPMEQDGSAKPLQHQIAKGSIKHITSEGVAITLRNRQTNFVYFQLSQRWVMEHDLLDSSFDMLYQSVADFLLVPKARRDLLLGLRAPRFSPDTVRLPAGVQLIGNQAELLQQAMNAQDYFLLQGPPGTGKTSRMLREMVRHLFAKPQENILLLAFTNRAVDEICKAVADCHDIEFLVLGATSEHRKNRTIGDISGSQKVPDTVGQIQKTRVFVSTVAGLLSHQDLLKHKHFTTAIVDEASQLLEAHLIGILAKVDRFILIGDEKQLPAVVTQNPEMTQVADWHLNEINICDLRDSLFDRLLKTCEVKRWHDAYGMLASQKRMHVEIAAFPNKYFYDGALVSPDPWQTAPNTRFNANSKNHIEKLLARSRVLFIPSLPELFPRTNNAEAEYVVLLLEAIEKAYGQLKPETVGVITPFRAQISFINKAIAHSKLREKCVTVDTVERYQGGERDIIIVSYAVRSASQMRNLQSLSADGRVDRKLNVALTRAKEHLILLGCPQALRGSPHFRNLMQHIEAAGGYIHEGL